MAHSEELGTIHREGESIEIDFEDDPIKSQVTNVDLKKFPSIFTSYSDTPVSPISFLKEISPFYSNNQGILGEHDMEKLRSKGA